MKLVVASLALLVACHRTPAKKDDPLDKFNDRMNELIGTAEKLGDKEQEIIATQVKQLDDVVDKTDEAIADKDYDRAELLASKIAWAPDPWVRGADSDSYVKN